MVVQSPHPILYSFSGTNNFINNSAEHAGAISMHNTILKLGGTNSFINNSAHHSGGAIYTSDNNVNFIGTNNFINNSAHWRERWCNLHIRQYF